MFSAMRMREDGTLISPLVTELSQPMGSLVPEAVERPPAEPPPLWQW